MHIIHMIRKRLIRWFFRLLYLFLPKDKERRLERWRRGREEYLKYRRTDYVVASFGKSGRTWLRVMLSRYYQLAYDIPERIMMGFDNFHRIDPEVPAIFFTHDNYLKDYTGNRESKRDYYDKKVVLLVRRPQDVAVSQYFQWKFRMRPHKIPLNRYPSQDEDVSIFDFVMNPDVGLPRIIDFLNLWASELPRLENVLMVRYEDMRSQPVHELGRIMGFLDARVDRPALEGAVEFASVENLRKLESQNFFWRSGSRLTPRDKSNPDSYKVRRAKVGGYRDYFDDEQLAEIDSLVSGRLSPIFGYDQPAGVPASQAGAAGGG
jgi:hypothetical protein